ncbi:hypothetical protein [Bradyrhizobium sp. AUGA SZCCT0283]|uniref:hypothetical protein n=1 Tax=Bradyrhizobium sp. AUGA SZCCT0283 TaxID=2807671 RepID=UPI001BAB0353|nr:hypothetical protein [Bradyrhizobium sp. AUGA SZCCT0283]MBR1277469.1 hypothetical protein [Bradyrhizobium sp. AUGA SZCCT0283]
MPDQTPRGYIAMPRSIFGDPSFAQEPYTEREAFLSLVANAAWKPRRLRLRRGAVDLSRGQLLVSSRFLAEGWQWPEPRVRRFMDRISGRRAIDAQTDAPNDAQSDALIDAQPTPHGTIITIRNYDSFQGEAKSAAGQDDAQSDAQSDAPSDAPLDAKSTQREEEINNNTLLKESESARATRIPDDFDLDDETYNWALDRLGSAEAIAASMDRFRNHNRQVAGNHGLSRDWQAKARLWIDDDVRRRGATAAPMPARNDAPSEANWDQVLAFYAKTGIWTRHVDTYGFEPGSPACRAPRELLKKHGLAASAGAAA